MARFIFEMPDDLAQRVEAYRRAHGLKATAQAVRMLLERGLLSAAISKAAVETCREVSPNMFEERASENVVQLGPAKPPPGSRLKKR